MDLNLPEFTFKLKKEKKGYYIFDEIRTKWLFLTPEEWVRQNFIKYLINNKNYPSSRIGVEVQIKVNNLDRRCDVIVYNETLEPVCMVECKAAALELNQAVFDQALKYNTELNLNYIILTNGMKHYFCKKEEHSYIVSEEIPYYESIIRTRSMQ